MLISIHGGHSAYNKESPGVVGYINESIQDRIVKDKVKKYLEIDGHSVTDITVDDGSQNQILSKLVTRANVVNSDLNISIHFNAANGKAGGTETWIKVGDNRARDIAQRVNDRIVSLGFKNRGVKTSNGLYILNKMTAPTILVECCFADNIDDFKRYDADKMAYAIACGIVGHDIKIPDPIKHTSELVDVTAHGDTVPVFRLYNPNNGEHLFTQLVIESDVLIDAGWSFEGIAWYSPFSGIPVFRLYNPNSGEHFYTIAQNESSFLVSNGWTFEGTVFNSDIQEYRPVYRLYNPQAINAGGHFYTTNASEKETLEKGGWIYEGICWYGI